MRGTRLVGPDQARYFVSREGLEMAGGGGKVPMTDDSDRIAGGKRD